MTDLYSTPFYKIRFEIEERDKNLDLLWRIIIHIKEWMTKKHNINGQRNLSDNNSDWTALKTTTGGRIVGNNVQIVSENCLVEEPANSSFWACRIVESPVARPGVASRHWTTEIGVEPIANGIAMFSCIISYSDRSGFIGELEKTPIPSIPKIVKNLWNDAGLICRNGIDNPCDMPVELAPGDYLTFWERILNPGRILPYIYLSPLNVPDGEQKLLLNPQKLTTALGGNALVYYACDPSVTDEMNYFCPESYKCYNGTVRIYYPNVDETKPEDAFRHRFIDGRRIKEVGEEHIISMIRRAIVQDAISFDSFFRIEDCREKRNSIIRKKRLDELKKKHMAEMQLQQTQHSETILQIQEKKLDEAIEEERRRLEAEDKVCQLEFDNEQLRQDNYRLTTENDCYHGLAKENADLLRACNSRFAIKDYPNSNEALVQYFDSMFGDKIAFSEDAMKSLKGCTILLDELWHVFFSLATIMCDIYINGNGDIFKEFKEKSNVDVSRGEGRMTRKDKGLMRQYETEYYGETIDIEPHITYAKIGQSIHFGFSKRNQKIIVGWCGEHKDNFTTQKVH